MGLRENTDSNCEHSPIAGKIAMYTSGCPKNQNRCCHKSGEPPLCPVSTPFTVPSGTKKLVPRVRSMNKRMPAEGSTPNASNVEIEVMTHAEQVEVMRIKVMPLARLSRGDKMKFSAPIITPMHQ